MLAGILCGYALFNVLSFALVVQDGVPELLWAIVVGIWVFEPMLFGAWAALGPGGFLTRTLLIIPCLILVLAAPGVYRLNFHNVERYEFVVVAVAAMAIFAVVTAMLLICRRWFGWHIDDASLTSTRGQSFQYDMKYLIALLTLYGAALGITGSLQFGPPEPQPMFLGPGFIIFVLAIGSTICALTLLPMLAVPLLMLSDGPSEKLLRRAVIFWLMVTLGMTTYLVVEDGMETTLFPLALQLGAVVSGTLTALPLQQAGCRFSNERPLAIDFAILNYD